MDPHGATPPANAEPHRTLADPTLSRDQKEEALETLEQDARQLSVAASEGMPGSGPEDLGDILDARAALDLPAVAQAYALVHQDLHARLGHGATGDARGVVEQALAALAAVERLPAATPPATEAERNDEAARERLDP